MSATVFITGVSTGLGASLAQYYLKQGATVLGCSRRTPEFVTESSFPQDRFRFVPLDLSDFEQIPRQLSVLFAGISQCDLAILNAGILSPYGDLHEVSVADCQRVLDVNLWANKVVLDWLIDQAFPVSQVVAVSSGAGVHGKRGWNAYAISKAALNMLVKLYAQECPETHFSAVGPGPIETAMQEHLCQLPSDARFPSLDSLKVRRHTPEMPTADELAPRLAAACAEAPQHLSSGEFFSLRQLPW